MTGKETIQRLGLLIDKAENYLSYQSVPIPPILRNDAYHLALQDLRNELRRLYFDLGGTDAWDTP